MRRALGWKVLGRDGDCRLCPLRDDRNGDWDNVGGVIRFGQAQDDGGVDSGAVDPFTRPRGDPVGEVPGRQWTVALGERHATQGIKITPVSYTHLRAHETVL